MDSDRTVQILEEIRELQRQLLESHRQALRNQEQAIAAQTTAIARAQRLQLALGVAIAMVFAAVLLLLRYLLQLA